MNKSKLILRKIILLIIIFCIPNTLFALSPKSSNFENLSDDERIESNISPLFLDPINQILKRAYYRVGLSYKEPENDLWKYDTSFFEDNSLDINHTVSKKKRKELNELYSLFDNNFDESIGYPINIQYFVDQIAKLWDFPYKNIGTEQEGDLYYPYNTLNIEKEALLDIASMLNIREKNLRGYITSGGTGGNKFAAFLGAMIARSYNKLHILLNTSETHYSNNKSARELNLNEIMINSNENGTINLTLFEEEIIKAKNQSEKVNKDLFISVIANIGTTMKGAIDDVVGIKNILEKYGFKRAGKDFKKGDDGYYIHGDGALFAMLLGLANKKIILDDNKTTVDFVKFIRIFNSFAISIHKFFGSPKPAGIVYFEQSVINYMNWNTYIKHLNITNHTLNFERSGWIALLLHLNNMIRKDTYKAEVDYCLNLAKALKTDMENLGMEPELNQMSNTVYFPRLKDQELLDDMNVVSTDIISHIICMQGTKPQKLKLFLKRYYRFLNTKEISEDFKFKLDEIDAYNLPKITKELEKKISSFVDETVTKFTTQRKKFNYNVNPSSSFKELIKFLKFPLNNIGDPFQVSGHYKLHTKDIEKRAIMWLMDFYKMDKDKGWGAMCSGSHPANRSALWIARKRLTKKGEKDPILLFSNESPPSITNLDDEQNLDKEIIDTDFKGEMDYNDLKIKLSKIREKKRKVIINLNYGSLKGGIDNIHKVNAILNELKFERNKDYHIHVEASANSISLPALLAEKQLLNLKDNYMIDSITGSLQEFIGGNSPTGFVIIRDEKWREFVSEKVLYTDSFDPTTEGSRDAFNPLFLDIAIDKRGKTFNKEAKYIREGALYLYKRLVEELNYPAFLNAPNAVLIKNLALNKADGYTAFYVNQDKTKKDVDDFIDEIKNSLSEGRIESLKDSKRQLRTEFFEKLELINNVTQDNIKSILNSKDYQLRFTPFELEDMVIEFLKKNNIQTPKKNSNINISN